MMCLRDLLAFLLLVVAVSSYKYDPTEEEIEQAIAFQKPRSGWGYQARQEREVRLLCIGGSNTDHGYYTKPLSAYLTNSSAHSSWNGSLEQQSQAGTGPDYFVGLKYGFEHRPTNTWPNIISLDFSMNTYGQIQFDKIAETIDAVMRTIDYKYRNAGVQAPDYMFLELMNVQMCVNIVAKLRNVTVEEKMQLLNFNSTFKDREQSLGHARGCPTCKEIRSVADFYDYPTVSWRQLAYSAFIRYFLAEDLNEYSKNTFRYTIDGLHITVDGGQLLTDVLYTPFFQDVMRPRKELPVNQRHNLPEGIRMFPLSVRPLQLLSYTTWDPNPNTNLLSIIRKPSTWLPFKTHENIDGFRHGRMCYGTNTREDTLMLDFVVPSVCSALGDCKVSVGFLHSWNSSFVGGLTCDLIADRASSRTTLVTKYINTTLLNDGNEMHHTGAVQTQFDVTVHGGKHSLRCRKLDDKFTCLVMLYTAGTVLV